MLSLSVTTNRKGIDVDTLEFFFLLLTYIIVFLGLPLVWISSARQARLSSGSGSTAGLAVFLLLPLALGISVAATGIEGNVIYQCAASAGDWVMPILAMAILGGIYVAFGTQTEIYRVDPSGKKRHIATTDNVAEGVAQIVFVILLFPLLAPYLFISMWALFSAHVGWLEILFHTRSTLGICLPRTETPAIFTFVDQNSHLLAFLLIAYVAGINRKSVV